MDIISDHVMAFLTKNKTKGNNIIKLQVTIHTSGTYYNILYLIQIFLRYH